MQQNNSNCPKEDVRIKRTKRDLVNALEELLNEKSYDDICVKDITDRAMISKNTFYNNFDEKNDLMMLLFDRQLESLYKEIDPLFTKYSHLQKITFLKKFIETVVHYFYTTPLPIFKMIKEDQSHSVFYCMNVFLQKAIADVEKKYGKIYGDRVDSQVSSFFYCGSFTSLFYFSVLNNVQIEESKMTKDLILLALPLLR